MYQSHDILTQQKEQEIDAAWSRHQNPYRYKNVIRRGWLERHLALQDDLCAYCGITLLPRKVKGEEHRQATIDHIVPQSKDGPDKIWNTLAACRLCNGEKSNLPVAEFVTRAELYERARFAANCPDRLSGDPDSRYYDRVSMGRGVLVIMNGTSRKNIVEYCVSDRWVRSNVPRSKDRHGYPMTLKIKGEVVALYRDNLVRVETMETGNFAAAFDDWLGSRCFKTGTSKDYLRRE